jgi:uncharacterized protein (TIGR02646 family)
MIKLLKGDKPQVLKDNAATWGKTLVDKKARGEKPTDPDKARYRHPDIKVALIAETHGKCAYCESKLLHIAYGDIEHITPKSVKIELSVEWQNLTLACDRCNTNKGPLLFRWSACFREATEQLRQTDGDQTRTKSC